MNILIVFNHQPYDGSDVAWNGLRLVKNLHERGEKVRVFLMNDSVDLARECNVKPETYDHDLVAMLKELYADGVELKVCGTCQARCGLFKNEPYFSEAIKGTMPELGTWTLEADRILTF